MSMKSNKAPKTPKKFRFNRRHREPFTARARAFMARRALSISISVVLPALAFAGWTGYRELVTTPFLAVRELSVVAGARVSAQDIAGLSGIESGTNIYSFRLEDVADRVEKNPWVAKAKVERVLPDTLSIDVVEREPLAFVKAEAMYVMDTSGVVFKKAEKGDKLDLPVITGYTESLLGNAGQTEGLLALLAVLRGRQGLINIQKVSEINIEPVHGFSVVTLGEGVRLELGSNAFDERIEAFEKVVALRRGSLAGIEAVDLTMGNSAIVRFETGTVKEGGAI